MYSTIIWQKEDNIGHLILNRPPTNHMDKVFFDELGTLVSNIDTETDLNAIVIYGKGRHFSSGANLQDLLNLTGKNIKRNSLGKIISYPDFFQMNLKTCLHLENLNIPVIAAIRGVCLGSALELSLFSHFRLCAKGAVLGFPETTFNLMPGCGGTQKLPRLTGSSKAIELLLTGNNFSPEEALRWNIIDKIVPKKNIVEIAVNFAKKIASNYNKEDSKYYVNKYLRNTN